jgi:hypothetical protein
VTREEAQQERDRLSEEHPEATWFVREEEDGQWSVLKADLPQSQSAALTAETQADERPPYPDDPRSAQWRNAPYGNL